MSEMTADNDLGADLTMRARELALLQEVTRIVQHDLSTADFLARVTDAIQQSWPGPAAIGVRSRLGTFEITTTDFGSLTPAHRAEFVIADGRTGSIEVAYTDDRSITADNTALSTLLKDLTGMFRTAVDRRLAMTALQQSEQRYRSMVEQQSDLVCRYLPDTTLTFVNAAYCRFFGKSRDELMGYRFIELIPDADRPAAMKHIEVLLRGGDPMVYEHNVLLPDGNTGRQQWIDQAIAPRDGHLHELQGIGRDITDRWRAEEALRQKEMSLREAYERIRSLAHRLILAQEAERTQIARELHDDVSQQLAALGIGLSLLEARLPDTESVRHEVTNLRQMASGLAEKVRHVSHSLHPGVLQHAGLNAAIASHCEAVASQHQFLVRFEARGTFNDVPSDVALCLYRAAQQGLRNIAMHARASRAWVTLVRVGSQIELTITDNGRGFDTSAAHARGIGLLSIEERVHLANGKFSVTSRLGGGSRLSVSVPVGWA
ncbi:MAG TPA: PAS domain-containing sensor histidine kinase [Vicinamibacterales bacterium]|nr:PAS domain-containing sensor histidine kinase [Vicinamibacterales bacterium]